MEKIKIRKIGISQRELLNRNVDFCFRHPHRDDKKNSPPFLNYGVGTFVLETMSKDYTTSFIIEDKILGLYCEKRGLNSFESFDPTMDAIIKMLEERFALIGTWKSKPELKDELERLEKEDEHLSHLFRKKTKAEMSLCGIYK